MRGRNILAIILPLLLVFAAIFMITGSTQEQSSQAKNQRKRFDENRLPIADYSAGESSDPSERLKRREKSKKYDKSEWRIYPGATSNMVRVDAVDLNLPDLPVAKSEAVIIGQIMDAKAYLSNDKSGVYSAFNVRVDEVIKNSSGKSLSVGSLVEVERDGGRVRFPNGRLLVYSINDYDMPQIDSRYVFFLTSPNDSDFQILTGYELREGKVYPLDDLPKLRRFENTDEATLLRELRSSLVQQ